MPREQGPGKGIELTVSELKAVLEKLESEGKGGYGVSVAAEYGIGELAEINDLYENVDFFGQS